MFINDPIHGFIELNDLQSSLLELPEMQRLQWIRQLGLSFLSYPGGVHTRSSHAIGVSRVAGEMARIFNLPVEQQWLVQAAGLLHDIGHTPFSHALESLLAEDHMELTRNLITGDARFSFARAGWIPEVLRRYGVDPEEVGDLIVGRHPDPILQLIIHGSIDSDQLDYLLRDSYFTGISHGQIDLYRILHTLKPDHLLGCIHLMEKGLDAIEEMLVARDHMYSAVYAHKTGRIAETMLLRAMELAVSSIDGWYEMIDADLLSCIRRTGGVSAALIEKIIFRQLYKTAFSISSRGEDGLRQTMTNQIGRMSRQEIEGLLTERCGFGPGELIVDMPIDVLTFSEPRLQKIELPVLRKSGERSDLYAMSALARVLAEKESSHTVFAVYTEEENVGRARAVTETWLGI
ncbi:MAG: HD domain-containing protein [bacterium]|nr:HD domain-containing protein [bacterium]